MSFGAIGTATRYAMGAALLAPLATTEPSPMLGTIGAAAGSAWGWRGALLGGAAGYFLPTAPRHALATGAGMAIGRGSGVRHGAAFGALAGLAGATLWQESPRPFALGLAGFGAGWAATGSRLAGLGIGALASGAGSAGLQAYEEGPESVYVPTAAYAGIGLGAAGAGWAAARALRGGTGLGPLARFALTRRHPTATILAGTAAVGLAQGVAPAFEHSAAPYERQARGMDPNFMSAGGVALALHYKHNYGRMRT